jgi:hypothetical protein
MTPRSGVCGYITFVSFRKSEEKDIFFILLGKPMLQQQECLINVVVSGPRLRKQGFLQTATCFGTTPGTFKLRQSMPQGGLVLLLHTLRDLHPTKDIRD